MTDSFSDAGLPAMCSLRSAAIGEDPIGSASKPDLILAIETPLPWPKRAREAMSLPTGTAAAIDALDAGRSVLFVTIAPDPEYSVPGFRRVLLYRRPDGPFVDFVAEEYLVPLADLPVLARGFADESEAARELASRYRQAGPARRDLLVCTHGTRDNCCAVFGVPVYQHLRDLAATEEPEWRVWRCSHLGGHRFAPTLVDLPSGRVWGRMSPATCEIALRFQGDPAEVRSHYRGWAGLQTNLEQIAEREALAAEGWAWTRFHKAARIRWQSDDGARTEVEIHFADPHSGHAGTYVVTLEWAGTLQSRGSCIGTKISTVERYTVAGVELERAAADAARAAD